MINRLTYIVGFLFCAVALAWAQSTTMPPPGGTTVVLCTYQASAQALNSGFPAFLQCDQNGNLVVSTSPTGLQQIVGNIANGVADAGNPVKIGCVYNQFAVSVTTGQRINCQSTSSGEILHLPALIPLTTSDALTNNSSAASWPSQGQAGNFPIQPYILNGYFNGTTWDRVRGNTSGAFSQGNIASGASDVGNPVKFGCVYNSTTPTLTNGQRGDCQTDASGNLRVQIRGLQTTPGDALANAGIEGDITQSASDASVRRVGILPYYFNGTTWDRSRGDTNGAWSVARGSASMATTQVTVTTGSIQIVGARANRSSVQICNLGTTDIYLGNTGVSSPTGQLLLGAKGTCITIPTNAAVFGATGVAGTQAVSAMETF